MRARKARRGSRQRICVTDTDRARLAAELFASLTRDQIGSHIRAIAREPERFQCAPAKLAVLQFGLAADYPVRVLGLVIAADTGPAPRDFEGWLDGMRLLRTEAERDAAAITTPVLQ